MLGRLVPERVNRYKPALPRRPALRKALLGAFLHGHAVAAPFAPNNTQSEGCKMPKLKTKSGAKKRFKVTGTGKVVHAQEGKRHGMIKRTKKQIRNLRGTRVLFKSDGDNVKKYFLPHA
jgi:large subunit ribosomal protein L35